MGKCFSMSEYACDCYEVHDDIVAKVLEVMPDDGKLCDVAEFLKVFGNQTRIKIVFSLCKSEMCVCDLTKILNMTQSAVSHQLRILKQARLVKTRRDGKTVFYSICDDHVQKIFQCAMEHVTE